MRARGERPSMVLVSWVDARSVWEQYPLSEAAAKCPLVKRESLGFIVHRDKERLLLCHTFDPAAEEDAADGGADYLVLPRSWVVKVHELTMGGEEHADSPGLT